MHIAQAKPHTSAQYRGQKPKVFGSKLSLVPARHKRSKQQKKGRKESAVSNKRKQAA